jgi:UDP:flavonoid glycosyltransferase YjiC (YdhE family)
VVLATLGSLGDLHPFLALAREVNARGGVAVVATSALHRERVERQGLEFRPLRPSFEGLEDDPELFRKAMDRKAGPEFVIRRLLLPYVREGFADLLAAVEGADLLVAHAIVFAGPLVAERTGLPWASVALAPLSMFSAHDPSFTSQMVWLRHFVRLGPVFWAPFYGAARWVSWGWSEPVRSARRELGLRPPPREPLIDGARDAGLVLALFSPALGAPQPDWPPQTVQAGFAFLDDSLAEGFDPGLGRFLDAGPPPLVFTLGSSAVMDAGRFYEESLAAARALGRRPVLLIGRDPRNRPRGPLDGSVYVAEYAPYSALLPRAAAVVHQGGVGTTGQALRAGRPMVVVPWSHDQPDNAERVRRLGVAAVIPRGRYDARTAARVLRRLLDDPGVAARAEAVGRRVRAEDGAAAACDALERLLAASAHGGQGG